MGVTKYIVYFVTSFLYEKGMGAMSKYSAERDKISKLCRMYGVNYSEKTVKNFQSFFEGYADIREEMSYLPQHVNSDVLNREAADLFKAMILHSEISRTDIDKFLVGLMKDGNLEEMIAVALKDVKSYGPAGEIYHTIVYRLYIDKVRHTWNEVQTEIGYSKSRYYEKKEYAVMLFGLMLWRQILAYWSNSTEEMFILEKEVGRDGSLAEERRNYIEEK